ncbi:hypothetical protein Hanom_Chr04g00361091 [Helianthus anomalus]
MIFKLSISHRDYRYLKYRSLNDIYFFYSINCLANNYITYHYQLQLKLDQPYPNIHNSRHPNISIIRTINRLPIHRPIPPIRHIPTPTRSIRIRQNINLNRLRDHTKPIHTHTLIIKILQSKNPRPGPPLSLDITRLFRHLKPTHWTRIVIN